MSGQSIEFTSEKRHESWQYRVMLWFITQALDVSAAFDYWLEKLEEWAAKRWVNQNEKIGHSGKPWCEDLTPHYRDYKNRVGEVNPGDIVYFDWDDDSKDQELKVVRRLKTCVERWPECYSGGYDPRCCRFPKSCSASIFDPENYKDEDLV